MTEKIIMNEDIKAEKVFVIGVNGERIGLVPTKKAIQDAEDLEVDLIVIGVSGDTTTARMIAYDKYMYEQKRKEKQNRKNSKTAELKELRLSANIADNDLNTKLKAARKFFEAGNEVKFSLRCRGREITRIAQFSEILDKAAESLSDCSSIKSPKKIEGRIASIILKPGSGK